MWLIDADKLKEIITNNDYNVVACHNSMDRGMFTTGIIQAIDEASTIDAKPVIHGRWTRTKDLLGEDITVCSNCDEIMRQASGNYCAYCGADMREEKRMRYKDRQQKRKVNEIMVSLLYPLKNHLNDETIEAVETALRILQEAEVENGEV